MAAWRRQPAYGEKRKCEMKKSRLKKIINGVGSKKNNQSERKYRKIVKVKAAAGGNKQSSKSQPEASSMAKNRQWRKKEIKLKSGVICERKYAQSKCQWRKSKSGGSNGERKSKLKRMKAGEMTERKLIAENIEEMAISAAINERRSAVTKKRRSQRK
jgi:hypothetical protein